MKVRATNASKLYNKALKELHRIPEEGEIFEVTEERYHFLRGNNKYHVAFVELVDQPQPVMVEVDTVEEPEVIVIEPKKQTTKKRSTKNAQGNKGKA